MSTLDLHGYRIQEAWQEFHTFINDEVTDGNRKYSVVITGNGEMKQEFEKWCDQYNFIREVRPLERGGGFKVFFFKKRT